MLAQNVNITADLSLEQPEVLVGLLLANILILVAVFLYARNQWEVAIHLFKKLGVEYLYFSLFSCNAFCLA